MPRRLASRFAQATTLGCSRIDTGVYLSAPFGGRPRLARTSPARPRSPNEQPRAPRRSLTALAVRLVRIEEGRQMQDFIAEALREYLRARLRP